MVDCVPVFPLVCILSSTDLSPGCLRAEGITEVSVMFPGRYTPDQSRAGARLVRSQGSTGEISGPAQLSQQDTARLGPGTALTSLTNYNYQEAIRPELTDPAHSGVIL